MNAVAYRFTYALINITCWKGQKIVKVIKIYIYELENKFENNRLLHNVLDRWHIFVAVLWSRECISFYLIAVLSVTYVNVGHYWHNIVHYVKTFIIKCDIPLLCVGKWRCVFFLIALSEKSLKSLESDDFHLKWT